MESEESSWADASSTATLSESTASSRCSSIVSYEYNPDDFPKVCEIEEFQSPSFEWPSSRALSRTESAARPAAIQINKLPKDVAKKLQIKMDHLNMLLSLSGAAGLLYNDASSSHIISDAQQNLDSASGFITKSRPRGSAFAKAVNETVAQLDAAIASMSELLGEKVLLMMPIQLADLVANTAGKVQAHHSSYGDSRAVKAKAERLARLLWKAARTDLYERPIRRILADSIHTLNRALWLVNKCRAQGSLVGRAFITIPFDAFMEIPMELDNAINNISWLIRVSLPSASSANDDEDIDSNLGLPPIATKEPILCPVWKQVAKLLKGTPEDKARAAAALASAVESNRLGKAIAEEGGVQPLLKLVKEGTPDAQQSAASALGWLSHDPQCAEVMVQSGDACSIFTDALKEGSPVPQLQGIVAWAVSELAEHYPQCIEIFAQKNVVEPLVEHLLCENEMVPVNVDVRRFSDTDSDARFSDTDSDAEEALGQQLPDRNYDERVLESLKINAARALCILALGNSTICRSIIDSKFMVHILNLLENRHEDLQYNTAVLFADIACVAQVDDDLRRYAFNPSTSHPAAAVVERMLQIVANAEYDDLLVPCVVALGSLSEIFSTTEPIGPLVRMLDDRPDDVIREAAKALLKFAERENDMQVSHCKAIVAEGGVRHLVRIVRKTSQKPALLLICYVTIHDTENKELGEQWVINLLDWAAAQRDLVEDPTVNRLLKEAKDKLNKHLAAEWDRNELLSVEDVEPNSPIYVDDRVSRIPDEMKQESDEQWLRCFKEEVDDEDDEKIDGFNGFRIKRATSLPDWGRPQTVTAPLRSVSSLKPEHPSPNIPVRHPLPDYEEFAARFKTLKRNHQAYYYEFDDNLSDDLDANLDSLSTSHQPDYHESDDQIFDDSDANFDSLTTDHLADYDDLVARFNALKRSHKYELQKN